MPFLELSAGWVIAVGGWDLLAQDLIILTNILCKPLGACVTKLVKEKSCLNYFLTKKPDIWG